MTFVFFFGAGTCAAGAQSDSDAASLALRVDPDGGLPGIFRV